MGAEINTKTKSMPNKYMKRAMEIIGSATGDYVAEVMPTASGIASEARKAGAELASTLSSTTQSVMPKIRQLKAQMGFKQISAWFMGQSDDLDSDIDVDLNFDTDVDPDIDASVGAEMTMFNQGTTKVAKAVVESSQKLAESQIMATANMVTSIDKQTAEIRAGFKQTNSLLEELLKVVAKNTAALIETNTAVVVSQQQEDHNSNMLKSGKFDAAAYRKMIGSNLKNSELGMGISMVGSLIENPDMIKEMLSPEGLAKAGLSFVIDKKSPNFRKNLKSLDDAINDTIMSSLLRIGEKRGGDLRGIAGRIFGLDARRSAADTSKAELSLKSTPYDTISKEALTNAIPGYLRQLVILNGGPDMTYDYRSRSFKTKAAIRKEFADNNASTGTFSGASKELQGSINNTQFNQMMYDLMMNNLGANQNNSNHRKQIEAMRDNLDAAKEYARSLIGDGYGKSAIRAAEMYAEQLHKGLNRSDFAATALGNQVATTTHSRNLRAQEYANKARDYNMDLSDLEDSAELDRETIISRYGLKAQKTKNKASASVNASSGPGSKLGSGLGYTNKALYEIYRRLDNGINVYQMKEPPKPLKPKLPPPDGYRVSDTTSKKETGSADIVTEALKHPTNDEDNPLLNNEQQNGTQENLSGGERFSRWGSKRGGQLVKALFNGSPDDVRKVFADSVSDIGGLFKKQTEDELGKANKSFGDIAGMVRHKITGDGYTYQDGDETVHVKPNKGVVGFIGDELELMFDNAKKSAGNWLKDVIGYFDYGDDEDGDKSIVDGRKKILGASVGAFAGAGLLGGPIGLLVGGLGGAALSGSGVGKKLQNFLFGHEKDTGKPTGLLARAADAVMSPIEYQVSKTISVAGGMLKKNVLGPMADIGLAMKDRITTRIDSIFAPITDRMKEIGGKMAKTVGKGIATLATNMFGAKSKIGSTIVGKAVRGAFGLVTGGIGISEIMLGNKIGSRAFHKLSKGETYPLFVGQTYYDPKDVQEDDKGNRSHKHTLMPGNPRVGRLVNYPGPLGAPQFGVELDGDNPDEWRPATKDYLKWRREARKTKVNGDLTSMGFKGRGGYKKWREEKWERGEARRERFAAATAEIRMTPEEIAEEQKKQSEREHEETQASLDQITGEIIPGHSFKTHDQGVHERLDTIISYLTGKDASEAPSNDADIAIPPMKSDVDNADSREEYANTAMVVAGNTAAIGGLNDSDESAVMDIADEASKDSSDTGRINKKLRDILRSNKDKADGEEKEKKSFLSDVLGTIGSGAVGLITKFWPVILLGLGAMSEKFRSWVTEDLLPDVADWVKNNLPGILQTGLSLITGLGTTVNNAIENHASGATSVQDPVTGAWQNVMSAEGHAEALQNGILKTAMDTTMDPLRLGKDIAIMGAEKGALNLGAGIVKGLGGAASVGGNIVNVGTKLFQSGGAFIQGVQQGGFAKGADFAGRAWALGGSSTAQGVSNAGAEVAAGASGFRSRMGNILKPSNWFKPTTAANIVGGIASNIAAGTAWEAMDYAKHGNIIGDYGFGRAGGYVKTNTTVKTVTTTIVGTAGGIAIAHAVGAAGTAIAAAGGLAAVGSANFWNPVGIALLITAGVIAAAAAIGAIVNFLTGWATDAMDRGYAIRSNSAKLNKLLTSGIDYKNGEDNPMYVYCAQDSDRTIGLTAGINVRDPDVMIGQYMRKLADDLTSMPGAEILIHDIIKNMAVQGVPFAVDMVGASSNAADYKGAQANKSSCGDPPKLRDRVIGIDDTWVSYDTVKSHRDEIYNDVAANVKRQASNCVWTRDNLEYVYDLGEDVISTLKKYGVLDSSGKVQTNKFKGHPGDSKNADGWAALDTICRKNDLYFLTQCLVYINSKIEADKKTGEQWLVTRQDDLEKLFEGLKDFLVKDTPQNNGPENYPATGEDPDGHPTLGKKGASAEGAAELSSAPSALVEATTGVGIRAADQESARKELKYIAAAYAYSHPDYLQKWVEKHREESGVSVDYAPKIGRWDSFTNDNRQKTTMRSQMINAALKFAESAGDIFGLVDKFDWSASGKIYGGGSDSLANKYGAAFPFRGTTYGLNPTKPEPRKEGKSVLDEVFEDSNPSKYTPKDVHKRLFGKVDHGKASESRTLSGQDATVPGSGQLAMVTDAITTWPSDKGRELTRGEHNYGWRNALLNLPSWAPPNLPAGGPIEPEAFEEVDPQNPTTGDSSTLPGGNPLNKPFTVTSEYGPRTYPHKSFHKGVDIVPQGSKESPVSSRFNGTVVAVQKGITKTAQKDANGNYYFNGTSAESAGNYVKIKTDDGITVTNMHLKNNSIPSTVTPGAKVTIGQRIGDMGSTGWSTGPHLHYQMERNGESFNPIDSLNGGPAYSPGTTSTTGVETNADIDSTDMTTWVKGLLGIDTTSDDSDGTTSGEITLSGVINAVTAIGNEAMSMLFGDFASGDITGAGAELYDDTSNYFGYTGNIKCVEDFLTMCAKEIGTRDDGNNKVKYNKWYYGKEVSGPDYPWCMAFVQWCFEQAGLQLLVKTAGCGTLLDKYLAEDPSKVVYLRYQGHSNKNGVPKPGDLIIFSFKKPHDHVGIVEKVNGDTYTTIEGNTTDGSGSDWNGGVVARKTRYKKDVCAFVRVVNWDVFKQQVANAASGAGNVAEGAEGMFRYLKSIGYSDEAAAAVVGCWEHESTNRPKRVESDYLNDFKNTFGGNYDMVASDRKKFNAYSERVAKGRSGYFDKRDGKAYAGLGYAQWTGGRARNLLDFAKENGLRWYDAGTQLAFMNQEMQSSYKKTYQNLMAARDIDTATHAFAYGYEHGGMSDSSYQARLRSAKSIYQRLKGTVPTAGMGGPLTDAQRYDMTERSHKELVKEIDEGQNDRFKDVNSGVGGPAMTSGHYTPQQNRRRQSPRTTATYTERPPRAQQASRRAVGGPVTEPAPAGTFTSPTANNTDAIVNMLYQVIHHLESINKNTGTSSTLLGEMNDRTAASQTATRSRTTTTKNPAGVYRPSNGNNTRLVAAMLRP